MTPGASAGGALSNPPAAPAPLLVAQNAQGVTRNLICAYDSADRMATTMYYEVSETVTYAYDAAWRPYSMCGTIYDL